MKRNILFVTTNNVNPLCGGIDRITYLLAGELKGRGCKCISAYLQEFNQLRPADGVFAEEIELVEGDQCAQLMAVFERLEIDFIIAQGVSMQMNQEMIRLREAVNGQSRRIPLLFVFHQMPGHELNRMDYGVLLHKIGSKAWKQYIKQLFIQVTLSFGRRLLERSLFRKYSIPYRCADKIILLSASYIDDFNRLAGGSGSEKYTSIPNMLTYAADDVCGVEKKNEVLIVARMDEQAKRIKAALRIWKNVPPELLDNGWKLIVVGDGEDLSYYKQYVAAKRIRNVQFEGQQNPLSYYQRASVFMMTSAFEGWPMTLMEAMQNGCVPIVYDSFKAVNDIIETGDNGIIIPESDREAYVAHLSELMSDVESRRQMAMRARITCQRFSKERITGQWLLLFDSLTVDV